MFSFGQASSTARRLIEETARNLFALFSTPVIWFRAPDHRDMMLALCIALAGFALYLQISLLLSQGVYHHYYNLAFDYDPSRVFSLLTDPSPDKMGFKHPLLILFRPLGLLLMAAGLSPQTSVAVVMATCGAGTLTLAWAFLRVVGVRRPEALALTAFFAVTATQLVTSIVPETYSFATLSLALMWTIAAARQAQPAKLPRSQLLAAVLVSAITTTNLLQAFIAEWFVAGSKSSIFRRTAAVIALAIATLAIVAVASLMVWHQELLAASSDPLLALKKIWWMQPKGEKAGILQVVAAFVGYSFVAPEWSWLRLPEGTNMRDWRDWSFSGTGQLAMALWLAFLTAATVGAFAQRTMRPLAIGLTLVFLFNAVFHLKYQFRESLFLYAAHTHFVTFALTAALALWAEQRRVFRIAFVATTVVLAGLTASNNIPKIYEFATAFEKADTPCPAPCANGN